MLTKFEIGDVVRSTCGSTKGDTGIVILVSKPRKQVVVHFRYAGKSVMRAVWLEPVVAGEGEQS